MRRTQTLSGWGRFPFVETRCVHYQGPSDVQSDELVARGLGRGYGDCALSDSQILMMELNQIHQFDRQSGVIVADAGASLDQLLRYILPLGWFFPVTPGTRFVSLGGMIAADVHGKNHHQAGTLRHYIDWIDVLDSEQRINRLSPTDDPEWFRWTIGGMGLTGVILRAQMRLKKIESASMTEQCFVTRDLEETMAVFDSMDGSEYLVSWLDASGKKDQLGRGLVYAGAHAADGEPVSKAVPNPIMTIPDTGISVVNNWTANLFNMLYFHHSRRKRGITSQSLISYFYPLDGLQNWNRLYGARGFIQYQVVFPLKTAREGIEVLLRSLQRYRLVSPLTVLKKMGPAGDGLSFPMTGYTLTLDLPNNPTLRRSISALVDLGINYGGRFYLAKDAVMSSKQAFQSDPRLIDFVDFRKRRGFDRLFQSRLSQRLGL